MKYILGIIGLSLLSIPFFIWHALVVIWTFRTDKFKSFKHEVVDTLDDLYYRAFKSGKRRKSRMFIILCLLSLASCSTTESNQPVLTRDSKCYNACEPIPGEYQIKLNPDNIYIYDGPRFVDSLSYNEIDKLNDVFLKDNE